MANWIALKEAVATVIKTNGNQEITGAILQNTLNSIISNIGENATFVGVATPITVPGTPDGNVFYIAIQSGIYSNFGITILGTGLYIIKKSSNGWDLIELGQYTLKRTPFTGVTKYGSLAAYINDDPKTGAICLKTPLNSTSGGFGVFKFSIFDLNSIATNTGQQEINISFYISGGQMVAKSTNGFGTEIITTITTAFDGTNWIIVFNLTNEFTSYRHIILESVETSFSLNISDFSNGFTFDFITSTSGLSSITTISINNTVIKEQLDKYTLKRTPFTGVTKYGSLAAYINDDPRTGAICLKTPFGNNVNNGGFFVLNFSIFDLNSGGNISSRQHLSIPIYISGGTLSGISATSNGDSVILTVKAMLDSDSKWRFIFNDIASSTPYRHIILESVETSFGLNSIDITDLFEFSFITNTSGLGSSKDKNVNVNVPLSSKNIIADDSFSILSKLIVGQAKITKNTRTGNAIIIGDSTIDNVYGFDSVADYLPIVGTITDISTGGDDISNQQIKWNAISAGIKTAANYVFIQIGINNITNTTVITNLITELQSFIDLINSEATNAFLVIGTITPYYARLLEIYDVTQANIAQQKWVEFNESIKGNGSNPITNVDARADEHTTMLADSEGALKMIYNSGDQLHENNLGRLVIAQSWINKI